MNTFAKVVVAALIDLAAAQSAHAGVWIADKIIGLIFGQHAAGEADKEHEQLGKALDRAPGGAADGK